MTRNSRVGISADKRLHQLRRRQSVHSVEISVGEKYRKQSEDGGKPAHFNKQSYHDPVDEKTFRRNAADKRGRQTQRKSAKDCGRIFRCAGKQQ